LGVQSLTGRDIKRLPTLAEADVLRAIQLLPGVVASSDFSNKLYVRGGASDQNLIMLDNGIIYNPSHFGGVFSTFVADALDKVDFYKGGYPARWGNRLSSVLDIRQKQGETGWLRGSAGVSMLSSRLFLEGGGNGWNWHISGRRTYIDKVLEFFYERDLIDFQFPYYFYDSQGKVNLIPFEGDTISVSGYLGNDILELNPFLVEWGNRMVVLNYKHKYNSRIQSEHRISRSSFSQTFAISAGTIGNKELLRMENSIEDYSTCHHIRAELFDGHISRAGVDINYFDVFFRQASPLIGFDFKYPVYSALFNFFIEDEWLLHDDIEITPGIRSTVYPDIKPYNNLSGLPHLGLEPRLGFKVKIFPNVTAMCNISRYQQYLNTLIFDGQESINEFWIPLEKGFKIPTNNMVSGGLHFDFDAGLHVELDAYYKRFENLLLFVPGKNTTNNDPMSVEFKDYFEFIGGTAGGFECLIEHKRGTFSGYLSYSYSQSIIENTNAKGERIYIPANWDKTHACNLVLNVEHIGELGWFSRKKGTSITTGITNVIGRGLPFSEIEGRTAYHPAVNSGIRFLEMEGPKNGSRYPSYWRTDLTLIRASFKNEKSVLKQLGFYWNIINLFDHENILLYNTRYEDEDGNDLNPPEQDAITGFPRVYIFFGGEFAF
ncbi:MAG: TonB-dependent receptor, partial [bacterium]